MKLLKIPRTRGCVILMTAVTFLMPVNSTILSLISMTTRSTRHARKSQGAKSRLKRNVNTLTPKSRISATCVVLGTKPGQVSRTITPIVIKTVVTTITTRQMGSVKKRHNSSTTTAMLLLLTPTIPMFTRTPVTATPAQVLSSDLVLGQAMVL